ncbi:MAG: hypothetical protein ACYC1D_04210 [Acidimicrobiales bacterium]
MPAPDGPSTARQPIVASAHEATRPEPVFAPTDENDLRMLPDALHPEDPDDAWPTGPAKRGLRLRGSTAVLALLIAVAAGFWGGALAEKHHNPPTSATISALANRLSAARAGAFGGLGAASGGFATRGAVATSGLVTDVQGQTLYVTDASGALVKVTFAPSATITNSAASSLTGLHTGQTVVVRGTKKADGSVTATAVVVSPAAAPSAGTAAGG